MEPNGHMYTCREFMALQRLMCVSRLASRPWDASAATAYNQRRSVCVHIALILRSDQARDQGDVFVVLSRSPKCKG